MQYGSTVDQTSRITFESFYDNADLYNDYSLFMKLKEVYGKTYGFHNAEDYALSRVYKGELKQADGHTTLAKFFVLYKLISSIEDLHMQTFGATYPF